MHGLAVESISLRVISKAMQGATGRAEQSRGAHRSQPASAAPAGNTQNLFSIIIGNMLMFKKILK